MNMDQATGTVGFCGMVDGHEEILIGDPVRGIPHPVHIKNQNALTGFVIGSDW